MVSRVVVFAFAYRIFSNDHFVYNATPHALTDSELDTRMDTDVGRLFVHCIEIRIIPTFNVIDLRRA